ncbi:unnamed protein product [Moneuplotes crassus]|uniref:Uncharacterized protein n=1 Tax=Euplotes crassus TaxID=5936 RepID=A0AAD1Y913_EUPCR|nr:unnamed protein product [Moneuplotes crassus]
MNLYEALGWDWGKIYFDNIDSFHSRIQWSTNKLKRDLPYLPFVSKNRHSYLPRDLPCKPKKLGILDFGTNLKQLDIYKNSEFAELRFDPYHLNDLLYYFQDYEGKKVLYNGCKRVTLNYVVQRSQEQNIEDPETIDCLLEHLPSCESIRFRGFFTVRRLLRKFFAKINSLPNLHKIKTAEFGMGKNLTDPQLFIQKENAYIIGCISHKRVRDPEMHKLGQKMWYEPQYVLIKATHFEYKTINKSYLQLPNSVLLNRLESFEGYAIEIQNFNVINEDISKDKLKELYPEYSKQIEKVKAGMLLLLDFNSEIMLDMSEKSKICQHLTDKSSSYTLKLYPCSKNGEYKGCVSYKEAIKMLNNSSDKAGLLKIYVMQDIPLRWKCESFKKISYKDYNKLQKLHPAYCFCGDIKEQVDNFCEFIDTIMSFNVLEFRYNRLLLKKPKILDKLCQFLETNTQLRDLELEVPTIKALNKIFNSIRNNFLIKTLHLKIKGEISEALTKKLQCFQRERICCDILLSNNECTLYNSKPRSFTTYYPN